MLECYWPKWHISGRLCNFILAVARIRYHMARFRSSVGQYLFYIVISVKTWECSLYNTSHPILFCFQFGLEVRLLSNPTLGTCISWVMLFFCLEISPQLVSCLKQWTVRKNNSWLPSWKKPRKKHLQVARRGKWQKRNDDVQRLNASKYDLSQQKDEWVYSRKAKVIHCCDWAWFSAFLCVKCSDFFMFCQDLTWSSLVDNKIYLLLALVMWKLHFVITIISLSLPSSVFSECMSLPSCNFQRVYQ